MQRKSRQQLKILQITEQICRYGRGNGEFPLFYKEEVVMKIREAINDCDQLYKNTYKFGNKLKWLSDLDRRIYTELISPRKNPAITSFEGYTEDTDIETDLLVPDEYAEMYVKYLVSKIDYYNGEWERYNNSAAQFNELFSSYAAYYNRTHEYATHKRMRV